MMVKYFSNCKHKIQSYGLLPTVAVFEFFMAYYSVSEDSGVVSICLELINGTLTEKVFIQVMVSDNNGMSGCKQKNVVFYHWIYCTFL